MNKVFVDQSGDRRYGGDGGITRGKLRNRFPNARGSINCRKEDAYVLTDEDVATMESLDLDHLVSQIVLALRN